MSEKGRGGSMVEEGGLGNQSLALRLQKKVAGKLGNRSVAKHLISDSTAKLLDTVYQALKAIYDKKKAEKTLKGIIKTVTKVSLLERSDEFSTKDKEDLDRFVTKFRNLMLTVSSFIQVEYSYERLFLTKGLEDCEALLVSVVRRHLTDKSIDRIASTFATFANRDFLDPFFTKPELLTQRTAVANHISALLDGKP